MQTIRTFLLIAALTTIWGCSESTSECGDLSAQPVVFPPAKYAQMPDHKGDTFDLKDYKGKVVLINFWATWCGPCRYEIPDLVKLRQTFTEEDVAIIGVSIDLASGQQIQPVLNDFIGQYGINYPVVLDNKHKLISQFYRGSPNRMGVPLTYVIDQQGKVFKRHMGLPMDEKTNRPDPFGIYSANIQTLLDCI